MSTIETSERLFVNSFHFKGFLISQPTIAVSMHERHVVVLNRFGQGVYNFTSTYETKQTSFGELLNRRARTSTIGFWIPSGMRRPLHDFQVLT